MRVFHVATDGCDLAGGTADTPFRTISRAAQVAGPGDKVIVHEGVYREWVKPARGGISDSERVVYEAADGETVVIKGSEPVEGWSRETGTVWKARIPNSVFGDWNPFREVVSGDWLVRPRPPLARHVADIYVDGQCLSEASSLDEVRNPVIVSAVLDDRTGVEVEASEARKAGLVWYAEIYEDETIVWGNFQAYDPNAITVEVAVRPAVFFPTKPQVNFVTVRGFEMCQAATPWGPPTSAQIGIVGPYWATGWVIEDNIVHGSTCAGIVLGAPSWTGENWSSERNDKPGYQYQLEGVFLARQMGWNKEHVGSHIVRRNKVFDCGQAGIVGNLGAVFSKISDNEIYSIGVRREIYGHEIAGIKLHAAIDVQLMKNCIYGCSLGIWLDWEAQGTRVSCNVFFENQRDLFVEVSHGPYLVDHNIFLSGIALEIWSQGGGYVNNLICGALRREKVLNRATPYHRPHSTEVAGYAVVYGGDDRFVGNIFVRRASRSPYGAERADLARIEYGTAGYEDHVRSLREFRELASSSDAGDLERFESVKQPIYCRHNVYGPGCRGISGERQASAATEEIRAEARWVRDDVVVQLSVPEVLVLTRAEAACYSELGRVRLAGAEFEAVDGSKGVIGPDIQGVAKDGGGLFAAGPIAQVQTGSHDYVVWRRGVAGVEVDGVAAAAGSEGTGPE